MCNLCSRCCFSHVIEFNNGDFVYHCLLLEKVLNSYGVVLCSPFNKELDCPFFCSKDRTIDVFVKVHKKQFKKVDLSNLLDRVSISPEDLK